MNNIVRIYKSGGIYVAYDLTYGKIIVEDTDKETFLMNVVELASVILVDSSMADADR